MEDVYAYKAINSKINIVFFAKNATNTKMIVYSNVLIIHNCKKNN